MSDNLNTLKRCIRNDGPSSECIKKIRNFPVGVLGPNSRRIKELILVTAVHGPYRREGLKGIIVAYNNDPRNSKIKIYLTQPYVGNRGAIRITKMQKLANAQKVQWKILDQTWELIESEESSNFDIQKKEDDFEGDKKLEAAMAPTFIEEKVEIQSDEPSISSQGEEKIQVEIVEENEEYTLFTNETIENFKRLFYEQKIKE